MRTLAAWASVDHFHLHLAESLEKSLQVVELARHADDPHLEVNGHHLALRTLNHLGDGKNAEEHAKAALALAERLRSRHWLSVVLRNFVTLDHFLGDWRQARELVSHHIAVDPNYAPLLKELAWLEYELGESEQGEAYLRQMQEIMRQTPPGPRPEYADTSLASHFASRITGSIDCLEIAGQAAQVVLSSPLANPFWIDIVRTGLALKAVDTRDHASAQEEYTALTGLPGKMRGAFICADRLMGLLAHTMGNSDQAAVHFEDALAFCRKESFRPELAWTCYDYAEALQQRRTPGDSEKARSLLKEALSLSQELNMNPLTQRVVALKERADIQPKTDLAYPDGLTQREVEILRLITAGKSNSAIAEELVLSVRTVERHISNIYAKINARGRVDATSYALSHRLTH
jgi:ATP/maltotriose-dependent transcriptional regulator MalT